MGANPPREEIGLIGCGAMGVVDLLVYCGVRFGLSLGDELLDVLEYVEDGLAMTFDQGLLLVVVGVVLRLVQEDTEEAVGDDGRLLLYHVWSS